jgi:hypothetical protein
MIKSHAMAAEFLLLLESDTSAVSAMISISVTNVKLKNNTLTHSLRSERMSTLLSLFNAATTSTNLKKVIQLRAQTSHLTDQTLILTRRNLRRRSSTMLDLLRRISETDSLSLQARASSSHGPLETMVIMNGQKALFSFRQTVMISALTLSA